MKTTIRIDDALLQQAWNEAQRRGTSLASMIEEGLRLVLRMPPQSPETRISKLSAFFTPHTKRDSNVKVTVHEDPD